MSENEFNDAVDEAVDEQRQEYPADKVLWKREIRYGKENQKRSFVRVVEKTGKFGAYTQLQIFTPFKSNKTGKWYESAHVPLKQLPEVMSALEEAMEKFKDSISTSGSNAGYPG